MRATIIALTAATLVACNQSQDGQRERSPSRQAPVAAAAVQVPPVVYRLSEVDRLRVELPWSGPGTLRAPRVDVTTPKGRLYAQLPVQVQQAPSGGGTATAVLEVRGTPIDGLHMVGAWRFALADGGGAPLATATIDLQ